MLFRSALLKTDGSGKLTSYLFVPPKDEHSELWDGYRAGPIGAEKDHGFDKGYNNFDADKLIPGLLSGANKVYSLIGYKEEFSKRVSGWVKQARLKDRHTAAIEHLDAAPILANARRVKSEAEIELMRRGCEISAQAHKAAMQFVSPGMNEQSLEAYYLYKFAEHGSRFPAYTPIVAGGEHACILHYVENNKPLKNGDLVLIDAACEYEFYASDITRTFPVNGKFSPEQKALYNIVLDAQIAAIDATRIGNHYKYPHEVAVQILTQGLVDLGLLSGDVDELVESEAFRQFFMHGTGHWLGMDVHDVGAYKTGEDWRVYEAGMVVTVEPGLYVAPDDETVDAKWRGIGIRIEDDIVVTENGPLVLTKNVVKTVEEIESLMASL